MSVGPLMLASSSPRRRALVRLLGVPFEAAEADLDESPGPDESPTGLGTRLAAAKALAIAKQRPDAVVLGADTVVVLDGQILGKPRDPAEALAMMAGLRGRAHDVVTGVALACGERLEWLGSVRTEVVMRAYAAEEAAAWVESASGMDKAGGYAIQDDTFQPVERIVGCYPNVVGLPLCAASRAVRSTGIDIPAPRDATPPCSLCERARDVRW